MQNGGFNMAYWESKTGEISKEIGTDKEQIYLQMNNGLFQIVDSKW